MKLRNYEEVENQLEKFSIRSSEIYDVMHEIDNPSHEILL
jgi:hypothetical protein